MPRLRAWPLPGAGRHRRAGRRSWDGRQRVSDCGAPASCRGPQPAGPGSENAGAGALLGGVSARPILSAAPGLAIPAPPAAGVDAPAAAEERQLQPETDNRDARGLVRWLLGFRLWWRDGGVG